MLTGAVRRASCRVVGITDSGAEPPRTHVKHRRASPAGGDPVYDLSLVRLACDPDYATFTEGELRNKLAAIATTPRPAASPQPTFRPGDRVLIRTAAGELAATVREVVADPGGRAVYVVAPDAGTPFPQLIVAGTDLALLDEADTPHVVTAG